MISHPKIYFISPALFFCVLSLTMQILSAEEMKIPLVQMIQKGESVSVYVEGTPFFDYQGSEVQPPEGIDAVYARSGFIHPLRSPKGVVLTEAFPPDHPHQHAVFSAWTRARVAGTDEVLDFWNQHNRTGNVRHVMLNSFSEKDLSFSVDLEQIKADGTPVIHETWDVQVVPHPTFRIFDISIHQIPADASVKLPEYHYGGFAFRGRSIWSKADEESFESEFKILTSNGETDPEKANHARCRWFAAYGEDAGKTAGVVIMNHPSSYRYPQPVRIHPEMPYFVFTPVALGEFQIRIDQPYHARYRVMTFDGLPHEESIEEVFEQYVR